MSLTPIPPTVQQPRAGLAAKSMRTELIQRFNKTLGWGALAAILTTLVVYLVMPAWQLLAVLACEGFCLLLNHQTRKALHRKRLNAAGTWLLAAITLYYGIAFLFFQGATMELLFGFLLFTVVVGGLALSNRWYIWLSLALCQFVWAMLVRTFEPLPRLVVSDTAIPGLILLTTFGITLGILWQILKHSSKVGSLQAQVSTLQDHDRRLRREIKELGVLHTIAIAGTEANDEDEFIARATELIGATLYPDSFGVMLLDPSSSLLLAHDSYYIRSGLGTCPPVPVGKGITGAVAADGMPRRLGEVRQHSGYIAVDPHVHSELCVPLKIGGEIIGVINAESNRRNAFTAADERLLATLAGQLASTILRLRGQQENARLFALERQRSQELEELRQASLNLTASLEAEEVFQRILKSALQFTGGGDAHIFLYDGERLNFAAARWQGTEKSEPYTEPRRHGVTYTVAHTGRPLIIPQTRDHSLFADMEWDGAIAGIPLRIGNLVVGVMNVAYQTPHSFTDHELRMLNLLGDQAAIAIRNSELYTATQRQLRELKLLHALAVAVVEAEGEEELIARATTLIGRTLYPDNFGILLLDEDHQVLRPHPTYHHHSQMVIRAIPLDKGITVRAFVTGEPQRIADITQDTNALILEEDMRSELCVPLKIGAQVLGVINAESRHLDSFTAEDERLLITVANQLAIGIEKARLFEQAQQRATELAAALERLEEMDLLKSEFIQNVSHELRTPLAIIRGYIELLNNGNLGALLPDQQEPVAIIARRVDMLTKIIEDLTTILEVEAAQIQQEHIDIAALVRTAIVDFRFNAEQAALTLNSEVDVESAFISGDYVKLRRMLDNLIGNALKFTPAGGNITVRLREQEGNLVLEVQDTGIGIPEDKLERIFERFYQVDGSAKRRYGGTGLGLALVKQIAETHGGKVLVESRLNEGSTFFILLPYTGEGNGGNGDAGSADEGRTDVNHAQAVQNSAKQTRAESVQSVRK